MESGDYHHQSVNDTPNTEETMIESTVLDDETEERHDMSARCKELDRLASEFISQQYGLMDGMCE